MPLLIVYDRPSGRILEYPMDADGQLPFLTHFGCSLRDYCGGAVPEVVWADREMLAALDDFTAVSTASYGVSAGFSLQRNFSRALGGTVELTPVPPGRVPAQDRWLALNRCSFLFRAPVWMSCQKLILTRPVCPPFLSPGSRGNAVCLLEWIVKTRFAYPRVTGVYSGALERWRQRLPGAAGSAGVSRSELERLFRLTRPPSDATMNPYESLEV